MSDTGIVDTFLDTFTSYIDSGFGLLGGDVAFLVGILVGLDIVLAGVFWALAGEDNIPAQLIRKVLYVGFFALLLSNFQSLADIIFQSFAGLGLKATGTSLTSADLMRPGFVASTGFTDRSQARGDEEEHVAATRIWAIAAQPCDYSGLLPDGQLNYALLAFHGLSLLRQRRSTVAQPRRRRSPCAS